MYFYASWSIKLRSLHCQLVLSKQSFLENILYCFTFCYTHRKQLISVWAVNADSFLSNFLFVLAKDGSESDASQCLWWDSLFEGTVTFVEVLCKHYKASFVCLSHTNSVQALHLTPNLHMQKASIYIQCRFTHPSFKVHNLIINFSWHI